MVLVYLPSDTLLQHLLSYLGFSYPGHGVSLHSHVGPCRSASAVTDHAEAWREELLLAEGRGGDLTFPDLECQLLLLTLDEGYLQPPPLLTLGVELLLSAASPDLGRVVAPLGHRPHLQRVVAPLGHYA